MGRISAIIDRVKRKAKVLACTHPDEDRVPAGTMGHPLRWICRRCGHRSES